MHGNCNYVHVKACMKPVNGITHVQVQDLISYETSINIIYLYWYTNPLSKFNMDIEHDLFFKWYFLSKCSFKFNPLHICIVFASFCIPTVGSTMCRFSSHLQIVKCWDPPPRSFGRKLLMIQNQSLVAPVNHGWSTYPPGPRTPPHLDKGLIAGLIKGNQWLRSP